MKSSYLLLTAALTMAGGGALAQAQYPQPGAPAGTTNPAMPSHAPMTAPNEAPGTPARSPDAAPPTATKISADSFVQKFATSDMFEIESSKLAMKMTKDSGIRSFANMMIKDHGKSSMKLKALLKSETDLNVEVPKDLDQQHAQMIEELRGLSGKDFDRRYLEMQVQGHQQARDLLNDYIKNGDNAGLRQFAKATEPVVQKHLDQASKLAEKAGNS